MALQKATRSAQWPLVAYFDIDIANDSFVDIAGVTKNFKDTAPVFEPINLPNGAVVVGGQVTVITASDETGTATIAVGDSASANRYLTATSIKSPGSTALTVTGYEPAGLNIRVTLANQNGNAAAGKVRVTVMFIIKSRANEVYPS